LIGWLTADGGQHSLPLAHRLWNCFMFMLHASSSLYLLHLFYTAICTNGQPI
jgi:hypothetical protein